MTDKPEETANASQPSNNAQAVSSTDGGGETPVKISLKSGFSLKSTQVKKGTQVKRGADLGATSKPNLFFNEEVDTSGNKVQLVTGFDKDEGAILHPTEQREEPKKEYVIAPVPNKDWRNEALNKHVPIKSIKASGDEGVAADSQALTFGLNVPSARPQSTAEESVGDPVAEEEDEETIEPLTEQQAYDRDMASRPDAPSLDAYERMPVEEFGAALLRGMGWKGPDPDADESETKGPEKVIKRAALLGLGAKEVKDSPEEKELGAWGKSAKPKSNRPERSYVPLVKVSKVSGKIIEEDSEGDKTRDRSRVDQDRDERTDMSSRRSERDRYSDRRSDESSRRYRSERSERPREYRYSSRSDERRDSDRYSSGASKYESSSRQDRHRHSERDRDAHRSSKSGYSSRDRDRDSERRQNDSRGHDPRSSRKRHYDDHYEERTRKHSRS